ncbi:transmembrane protein 144-like [Oscarella lobularis]|uniref:transmembrane protein 144-like n=1 Tax=Oscarella lobularis TaxID=121494 RepID=UPI0033142453
MKSSFVFLCISATLAVLTITSAAPGRGNANATIPANRTQNGTVTCAGLNDQKKALEGFIAAFVAILFFGSNFVPVKKIDTGDGVFFQWIMCMGIWLCALVTQLVLSFHPNNNNNLNQTVPVPFEPEALLGGFLWATGNMFCVPVIKCLGLGLGMLIWGTVNCLGGWASGRFGLFGVEASLPGNEAENFSGVALCLLGVIMFVFVKSEGKKTKSNETDDERAHLLFSKKIQAETESTTLKDMSKASDDLDDSWVDRLNPKVKKIVGTVMAIAAGLLFGVSFDPVTHLEQSNCHNPQNGLDYAFSHFCGILLTSTSYLIIYCFIKKNKPQVIGEAILPGLLVGVMWAIAYGAWFIANANLTQTISYPIVATAPGLVSALWGIFIFAEIRGVKNLVFFSFACALIIGGSVLTALSKS